MKLYYDDITYDFCPSNCLQCINYQDSYRCSIFPNIRYWMGKRIRATETLGVFKL